MTLSSVGVGLGELSSVEEMGVAVEVAVLTGESLDSTDVCTHQETFVYISMNNKGIFTSIHMNKHIDISIN